MTPAKDSELEILQQELRAQGRAFAVATVVRTVDATSAKPGAKALVGENGQILSGWIGGGCARAAIGRAAITAIEDAAPQFVSLRPEELLDAEGVTAGDTRDGVRFARNGCPSRGSMDVFVDPVVPATELVIYGDSPVALALAELVGPFDLRCTLCAPGLTVDAAPGADRVLDSFAQDTEGAGRRYVVVATQGKGDEAALRAAIAVGAGHTAFVGSRRKFAALSDRLRASGMPQEALEAIQAPAGLDINAITPEEIALSILAQVIEQVRSGRRAKPESSRSV